jgi:hypothetical protein
LLKSGTCFGGHWDCPILCVCIPAVFINNWSYHLTYTLAGYYLTTCNAPNTAGGDNTTWPPRFPAMFLPTSWLIKDIVNS